MYSKITILGNLGGDPEARYTPDGTAVTNFNVATTTKISKTRNGEAVPCPEGWKESYNGKGWELTTWWRVTTWRGMAESCNQFLHKGSQVYIEGVVNGAERDVSQYPRIWKGNDGEARASYGLTAKLVKFVGSRDGSRENTGASHIP